MKPIEKQGYKIEKACEKYLVVLESKTPTIRACGRTNNIEEIHIFEQPTH